MLTFLIIAVSLVLFFSARRFMNENVSRKVFGSKRKKWLPYVYASSVSAMVLGLYSYTSADPKGLVLAAGVWLVSLSFRIKGHQPNKYSSPERFWDNYWDFGSTFLLQVRRWSAFVRELLSDVAAMLLFWSLLYLA